MLTILRLLIHNKMEDRIKDIMSAVFEVPASTINDDSSLDTIEAWDSLRQMNLVVALEEEFKIQFSDDEIMDMMSYPAIRSVLIKKTS